MVDFVNLWMFEEQIITSIKSIVIDANIVRLDKHLKVYNIFYQFHCSNLIISEREISIQLIAQ